MKVKYPACMSKLSIVMFSNDQLNNALKYHKETTYFITNFLVI